MLHFDHKAISKTILMGVALTSATAIQAAAGQPSPATPVTGDSLITLVLGLVAVLLLILALAWMLKRFSGLTTVNNDVFKVLAVYPMGARERLVLLDVKGQQLLLGVTPGRIECLHTFTEPVMDPGSLKSGSDFQQKLQTILGKGGQ